MLFCPGMDVCMYVCMYCMYVFYVYIYVCIHINTYRYILLYIYIKSNKKKQQHSTGPPQRKLRNEARAEKIRFLEDSAQIVIRVSMMTRDPFQGSSAAHRQKPMSIYFSSKNSSTSESNDEATVTCRTLLLREPSETPTFPSTALPPPDVGS